MPAEASASEASITRKPPVGFRLLETLLWSAPPRTRRAQELIPAGIFAAAHLSGLLALRQPSPAAIDPGKSDLEAVTYLDVPPPAEPQSPRRMVRPRPIAVSDAVTIPAAQGGVIHPDKAAGFQVLLAAKDLVTLPPPDASRAAAVDEQDYSGRGVVGGVAGGKPVPVLAAALAAELAREGRLSDDLAAAGPVEAELADVKPQLLNRDELAQRLVAAYPPLLQTAGIGGSVHLMFVVDTTGHVAIGSVRVESATLPQLVPAALAAVRHARFSPGRMAAPDGKLRAVPVLVGLPLTWVQAERKMSP